MRVLKSIARSRIPAHTHGDGNRAHTVFYDKIAIRARIMPVNRALPIVCRDGDECVRLISALRARKIAIVRRGLTIYALNQNANSRSNSNSKG